MQDSTSRSLLRLFIVSALAYLIALPWIQFPVTTLLKPIPILLLIILTFTKLAGNRNHQLLLAALIFSILGDIVLTLATKNMLEIGIGSFMLAHLCYIGVFWRNCHYNRTGILFFIPILLFVGASLYYLWPYLALMQIPVTIYIAILSLMVFYALQMRQNRRYIQVGALLFLASDFTLALALFVPGVARVGVEMLVIATYYMAQLLLTLGILSLNKASK